MKKHPPKGFHQIARYLRRNMTDAEKALWKTLRFRQMNEHKFRRQVPFGKYIADFVCHKARLIIEVDGGQHDLSSEPERLRTMFLQSQGYRILRFWNNEVMENVEGVYAVIDAALKEAPSLNHDEQEKLS
ncbi:MAG: endonuclease domain-containing protein [Alphaproteobacteria bacterium]|nr:endonuclease domain-containing protein [Alphaproteobacteria bacterium]